ncbi:MAG: hypothetical protein FJ317_07205, partial [SAR202 cluster bacterium]|nr:hypothetical protein [SAR202 cluster bacterium]
MCGNAMPERYILVIDAGTSAIRCHLFNSAGDSSAVHSVRWPYLAPEGASTLAREFDTATAWAAIQNMIGKTLKQAKIRAGDIQAVGVTSHRQGVAFLNAHGDDVYAGPNIDLRAVFEGAAIDEEHGDDVYKTTGHLPSFFFTPAKLRWFQTHQPETYRNIASVLPIADWI